MADTEKTSQTFDRYECWRPAYESVAVLAWAIAFSWVTWLLKIGCHLLGVLFFGH